MEFPPSRTSILAMGIRRVGFRRFITTATATATPPPEPRRYMATQQAIITLASASELGPTSPQEVTILTSAWAVRPAIPKQVGLTLRARTRPPISQAFSAQPLL